MRKVTKRDTGRYPCAVCKQAFGFKHVFPCPHASPVSLPGAGSGRKDDTGKQRWDLLPFGVVSLVVQVMTFGAAKYEANNWQKILSPDGRYFAALMRHLVAWRLDPTSKDPESGLLHLAHALCCLVFITSRAIGFDRILDATPGMEKP